MYSLLLAYAALQGQPVLDAADILTPAEEQSINQSLLAYEEKNDRQLAVVTVKSLEGQDVAQYAHGYFRFLKLGTKEANDGVLFLVAPNDRKMNITVGYGLEAELTDAHSGRILDETKDFFRNKDYAMGISFATDQIMDLTSLDAIAAKKEAARKKAIKKAASSDGDGVLWLWAFLFGGGTVGGFFLWRGHKRRKAEAEALRKRKAEDQARRDRIEASHRESDALLARQAAVVRPVKHVSPLPPFRGSAVSKPKKATTYVAPVIVPTPTPAPEPTRSYYTPTPSPTPTPTPSYDFGSSFSGGGGDSGGGGASSDW